MVNTLQFPVHLGMMTSFNRFYYWYNFFWSNVQLVRNLESVLLPYSNTPYLDLSRVAHFLLVYMYIYLWFLINCISCLLAVILIGCLVLWGLLVVPNTPWLILYGGWIYLRVMGALAYPMVSYITQLEEFILYIWQHMHGNGFNSH